MSEEDLQQQVIDLQARLAFQEDTLEFHTINIPHRLLI